MRSRENSRTGVLRWKNRLSILVISLAWAVVFVPALVYLAHHVHSGKGSHRVRTGRHGRRSVIRSLDGSSNSQDMLQSKRQVPWKLPKAPNDPALRTGHFKDVLEALASRQRQESFEAIFYTNEWGNDESHSGEGSTETYTRNARTLLSHTLQEFGVKDWIDSPCGDCNWQGKVDGIDEVTYLGLDIVPALIEGNKAKYENRTNMHFKQQDFINEPFPHQPDLILCRDMIQHNSLVDGVRAYYNMEQSGAKYLATTWHQLEAQIVYKMNRSHSVYMHAGKDAIMTHNENQPPGGMYYVNIFLHPFNFSKPEFFIKEGGEYNPQPEDQKTIGVWKLPALGLGDGQFFDISEETWRMADDQLIKVADMPAQTTP